MKQLNEACLIPEIQVVYHSSISKDSKVVKSSKDAFDIFSSVYDMTTIEWREEFRVLYLTRINDVLGVHLIGIGSATGTVVNIKAIVAVSSKINASGIILCHNHPSGSLKPSDSDIALTRKVGKGLELVEAKLLDHLIITKQGYFSFADEGML